MSERGTAVRVRSGLSIPVPTGWQILDALEARGPDGIAVSATTYPVSPGTEVADVVTRDQVPGAEPVGTPRAAVLFGGQQGLIQRFDSATASGFTQLAGYAVDGTRAFVVRATCPGERFEQLEPSIRSLLGGVAVERAGTGSSRRLDHDDDSAPGSVLAAYLAGRAVSPLPSRAGSLDGENLEVAWGATDDAAPRAATGNTVMLSAGELFAVADLHGQPTFPGVADAPGSERDALYRQARSVLLARGLVQFSSPDAIHVDDVISRIAQLAFQADVIADLSVVHGTNSRRVCYYVGRTGTLRLSTYPGDVYVCGEIDTSQVFADLLARLSASLDVIGADGSGPAEVPAIPAVHDGSQVRAALRRISVSGDRIDLTTLEIVAYEGGFYVREESGRWTRVTPDGMRQRLRQTLVG